LVFLSFKGLISEKTLLALLRSGYEPDADGKLHWKLFLLYLLERQQLEHCTKQAGDGYRVMVLYRVFGFCSGLCKYSRKKKMMSKMESRRRKGRSQGQCTGTTQKATNKQIWDGIWDSSMMVKHHHLAVFVMLKPVKMYKEESILRKNLIESVAALSSLLS